MWQNIIFVGLGSIVGGVSRYFISEWSRHLFPSSFPWGTFIVNIAGCFLTNDKNDPKKYPIPKGDVLTIIPPRQHTCSGLSSLFYRRILW